MSALNIRRLEDPDVEAACALFALAHPHHPPESPAAWRHRAATLDPRVRRCCWVAEQDGEVLGFGEFTQSTECFDPTRFILDLAVRPDRQGRGIGNQLYHTLRGALERLQPAGLHAWCSDIQPRASRFLEARGFVEQMREWESRLDLAGIPASGADPPPPGVSIRSFPSLQNDPRRNPKTIDLLNAIRQDVPSVVPPTPEPLERLEQDLRSPVVDPDLWLVALDGERYVGITQLLLTSRPGVLENGYTGVHRDYRRRGIATALKAAAIREARRRGYSTIITWNASTNEGMLGINRALGFARSMAWIEYVLDLPKT